MKIFAIRKAVLSVMAKKRSIVQDAKERVPLNVKTAAVRGMLNVPNAADADGSDSTVTVKTQSEKAANGTVKGKFVARSAEARAS